MMEQISTSIWRYHDASGSTSYLVIGESKAVMIDCGMTATPLMSMIRQITQLPIELLLTHAHPDHYGAASEFDCIWLNEKDFAVLDQLEPVFSGMGVAPLLRERVHVFTDGYVFDLGNRSLLAAELPGHTPGSTVFIDEAEKVIFSGDAVGSGDIVLMSVPLASGLKDYKQALSAFLQKSAGWADYTWHTGHYHQADRGEGHERNDPCRALLKDMVVLCGEILTGRIVGREVYEPFAPEGKARRAYMNRAGIVYCDSQK